MDSKKLNKQSGFTLVELLVVIAIIGILTAIGVPMYNGYQASAKVSATKQNFDSIKTFVAGEATKCSAGLVPTLNDPKAGGLTVACPAGLTATAGAAYFKAYALSVIKNPYNTSSTTAATTTVPPANNGELGISGTATATCAAGISIQTSIIDPATNATASYPTVAECIALQ